MTLKGLGKVLKIFPTLEESEGSALFLLGSSSFSGDLVLMDMLCHFFLEKRLTFLFKSMQLQRDSEYLVNHLDMWGSECWAVKWQNSTGNNTVQWSSSTLNYVPVPQTLPLGFALFSSWWTWGLICKLLQKVKQLLRLNALLPVGYTNVVIEKKCKDE